jgi:glycosyltransferase involved in cell wall biosynthesis
MKIGIDARCIESHWPIGGPARFLLNMLKYWPRIAPEHRYVLFFQNQVPHADYLEQDNVESVLIKGPKFLKGRRILGEQLLMPFAIRAHKPDVYFTPWYSAPLVTFGVKTVVAAWDIACNTHPSHYKLADIISFGGFMPPSCRKAAGLLTCSQFDARQIEKHYGIPSERICVVPFAADDKFAPIDDSEHLRAFRRKYGFPDRYILSMGGITRRRNVDVVIDAFLEIHEKYPDVGLVVIGRNITVPFVDIEHKMKPLIDKGRAFYLSRAPEEDIVDFYRAAWYYICTSTVDGESLMLKEAMRCGTPVITSPFLKETAGGNAVILEDPTDRRQTAEVLARVLSARELRDQYGRDGMRWIRSLSWEQVARDSLRFIESR